MGEVRLLLFGDTHLGFDLPVRPRVARRRRGEDFFRNTARVLEAARDLEVDAVVHGGDVFFRSRVPAPIVDRAYALFRDAVERGPPLFIVPGNHERSRLPPSLFLRHGRLHVFDRPRTFVVEARGRRVALSGVPFVRQARADVPGIAAALRATPPAADHHLLCLHQAVEGATVGPRDFVFRDREDTVRHGELGGWDLVLSGHIHRRQVLWARERRSRLPPVCYAGSVERTSFAEQREPKGFFVIALPDPGEPLAPSCFRFHPLPARPMRAIAIRARWGDTADAQRSIARRLAALPPDAIVRVRVEPATALAWLPAEAIRAATGPDQTVELVVPRPRRRRPPPRTPEHLPAHVGLAPIG